MRFLIFLVLYSSVLFAKTDPFENKKGIALGLGFTSIRYTYPADFDGTSKSKLDDEASLLGMGIQLGYDTIFSNKYLLGIRTEGMSLDNLGTGNKENNELNGTIRAASALLRAGLLFDIKTFDMVGDPSPFILEVFAEGGISTGHKRFAKYYATSDATESLNEKLDEEYQGRIISGGLNLMTFQGAFLEFKGAYTSITGNKQYFEGTKVENGGPTTSTTRQLDNENRGFMTWLLIMGHHY